MPPILAGAGLVLVAIFRKPILAWLTAMLKGEVTELLRTYRQHRELEMRKKQLDQS